MTASNGIQTVVLCGGKGTRLRERTESLPKVLVEVGSRPILWHIMKGYAHYGFSDFILALGHLGDRITEYFIDQDGWRGRDIRLRLGSGSPPQLLPSSDDGWSISCVDTGAETNSGGRIKRLSGHIEGDIFFTTYGDGVSDVDLSRLLEFHRSHGKVATVTVVRPRLTFGLLDVRDDNVVTRFEEKPRLMAGSTAASSCSTGGSSTTSRTTASSNGNPWSNWPRTASLWRSDTRASGPAWIPTRIRPISMRRGPPARPRGGPGASHDPRSANGRGDERDEPAASRPARIHRQTIETEPVPTCVLCGSERSRRLFQLPPWLCGLPRVRACPVVASRAIARSGLVL